jgi:hypothetical protein
VRMVCFKGGDFVDKELWKESARREKKCESRRWSAIAMRFEYEELRLALWFMDHKVSKG